MASNKADGLLTGAASSALRVFGEGRLELIQPRRLSVGVLSIYLDGGKPH